jgi:SAM-dependent methyltransferase
MPGTGDSAPLDFKTRLYERYLTQHVQLSAESVQLAFSQRGPYLRRIIAKCLPPDRSAQLLDLGCGHGAILHALRDAKYTNITGVDVSPEQIGPARQLGFEDVHCEDVREFLAQIPDSKFDVVIASDVLEHFTRPELLALTDEVHRVLTPGGRLVCHVPNAEGVFAGAIRYGDLTHEFAFTRGSIRQLAAACSFRVLTVREDTPVVHGLFSLVRFLIWSAGTIFICVLSTAESGVSICDRPLSENFLAVLVSI